MISIKTINEKIFIDVLYLWISRIVLYLFLFLITLVISNHLFLVFGPSSYSMESARYMVSALIQSEAAIMAIIVTLSLVAVELASSSYSVRMIDLLKSYNPDFWILMIIYIVSMIYSMFVLRSIPDKGNGAIEKQISFAYHTGVYSFVILFPYLIRTLNMLKPSTLLNIQAMKLTVSNINAAISSDVDKAQEKDPIQPIIDMISSSLLNHDFETTRNGLNIIGMRAKGIFSHNDRGMTERKVVANYVFSRLSRFGKFTLKHDDEEATFIVIRNLEILWEELKKTDPTESIMQASSSLEQIGTVAAELSQKNILSTVISHLYDIGQKALDNKDYDSEASRVIDSLGSVGVACIENRMEPRIIEEIIHDIGKLGLKASEKSFPASRYLALASMDSLKDSIQFVEIPEYQRLCRKIVRISGSIGQN